MSVSSIQRRDKRGKSRFAGAIVETIAAAWLCCGLTAGCSDSAQSEKVTTARRLLQLDKPSEALDALVLEEGEEGTAENHYLRTLALERLGRRDAAHDEIKTAVAQAPENPKYKGLQLRLPLFQGDFSVVEDLIALHEKNKSSAAVSMFGFYAHEAHSLALRSQNKENAAQQSHAAALEALNTAISLSGEIPEFQRELLAFAMKYELAANARVLVDRLLATAPDDPKLIKDKISVLVLTREMDEAVRLAEAEYRKQNRSEEMAEIYAAVLANAEPSPDRDVAFQRLLEQYPHGTQVLPKYVHYLSRASANSDRDEAFMALLQAHPNDSDVVSKYCVYLARSARLPEACAMLGERIEQLTEDEPRANLIYTAIYLPLEANAVQLAEEQLERYRPQISERLLVTYFEGRLLYLREQHAEALAKMTEIVKAQGSQVGKHRSLSIEALMWMKRIRVDQAVSQQLETVSKATEGTDQTPPDGSDKED